MRRCRKTASLALAATVSLGGCASIGALVITGHFHTYLGTQVDLGVLTFSLGPVGILLWPVALLDFPLSFTRTSDAPASVHTGIVTFGNGQEYGRAMNELRPPGKRMIELPQTDRAVKLTGDHPLLPDVPLLHQRVPSGDEVFLCGGSCAKVAWLHIKIEARGYTTVESDLPGTTCFLIVVLEKEVDPGPGR
ncbi:hypothetical protein HY251_11825 [bacterium]|nr:hypothetical protein [bacterium]